MPLLQEDAILFAMPLLQDAIPFAGQQYNELQPLLNLLNRWQVPVKSHLAVAVWTPQK